MKKGTIQKRFSGKPDLAVSRTYNFILIYNERGTPKYKKQKNRDKPDFNQKTQPKLFQ